ncbi:uncharacterized protein [Rutidosis leptorrhynchoides]|uniref:uncharacterized protein n=1 Tax=Rutidosis leptorrhynchoides TaxID=125765 RepID=UPI003A996761
MIKYGNGSHSLFWHDPWIFDISLATRFPRLYSLDQNRTSSVASRFSNGSWLWFWRRPPRGGVEDSEFTELCEALHSVSLSAVSDHWTWDNPPDNTFTVAQARRLIENSNSVSTSTFSMWCKTVPIKINIFIWRLNLDLLPTIPNLEHRDIF